MAWTIKAEYSGWTNYETWNVALWLGNDQGSYEMLQEWVQDAVEKNDYDADGAASDVADSIKDFVEENAPDLDASMYSDMLNAALGEVNYYEIAENEVSDYIRENPKEEEEPEEEEKEEEAPAEEPKQ